MATIVRPSMTGAIAVSADAVKSGKIKPLGYIVWFSVPDKPVKLSRLRKVWQVAGLDPTPLPKDTRAPDIFKRAMREQVKVGTFSDPKTGLKTETDVRPVLETPDEIIYQLTRVVRDPEDRTVGYPRALRAMYSKVTGDINFSTFKHEEGGPPRRELLDIMDSVQSYFDAQAKTVTGAKVRTLVRHYVKDIPDEEQKQYGLSGENLRGKAGGVYFVAAKHAAALESLGEFLDELYPHAQAYLYPVPLADGRSEREMIRRHHVANTLKSMDEEMATVAELLRGGRERAVRENVAKFHWNQLQQFKRRAAEYADLLRDEQEELGTRIDMMQRQLRKLV